VSAHRQQELTNDNSGQRLPQALELVRRQTVTGNYIAVNLVLGDLFRCQHFLVEPVREDTRLNR
jgi:hypothetical protein